MTCTNPFRLKDGEGGVLELPCGHCTACRIARSREWASRLMHEMTYYEKSTFVTLTYNDEKLPKDMGLIKDDLQRFFKRLRKNYPAGSLKYFASGEYGDRFKRPHYHAIIFGLGSNLTDKTILTAAWNNGFVYCGNVTFDSCRYVTDYVLKKYDGRKQKEIYGDKQTPFCLMSKGLGRRFIIDNREYLQQNRGFTVKGIPVGLPRYYKDATIKKEIDGEIHRIKILDIEYEQIRSDAINKSKEVIATFKERGLILKDDFAHSLLEAKKSSRDQAAKNLEAKNDLYKKML